MASPCILTGGGFQDSAGNVLANGYLTFNLSQDAASPAGEICAGVEIRFQLDGSGNIVGGSQIWGNDNITPINTFYRVTGFNAQGLPAWGPNNQQVVGTTFSLGSWIPNQVISWLPNTSGVSFSTNGVANSNQQTLNIVGVAPIVASNPTAGTVNIAYNSAAAPLVVGGFMGAGLTLPGPSYAGNIVGASMLGTANQVTVWEFTLPYAITITTVSIRITTGVAASTVNYGIYSTAGAKLLDSTALASATSATTSSATITAVTLAAGTYFFAASASATGVGVMTATLNANANPAIIAQINAKNVKIGQAANFTSAGVMPATLGTVTADSLGANLPIPLFEC